MLVDLHLHSTYSDGRYTPTELVRAAVYRGLRAIAITDHDSWNGVKEARLEAERLQNEYEKKRAAGLSQEQAIRELRLELAPYIGVAEAKSNDMVSEAEVTDFIQKKFLNPNEFFFCPGHKYETASEAIPLIQVVPGVELGTQWEGEAVHILGLHVDMGCVELKAVMDDMRHKREHRLEAMLKKLHNLDMDINVEAVDPENRAVGRPHVAKALVAAGYVKTVQEAFDKYLHRGGPAYEPQPKLAPAEAVDLIHKAGGLAILAHPSEIRDMKVPEYLLETLPFDGVEIWHPSAVNAELQQHWLSVARRLNLLTSGGSDFHGIPDRFPPKLGVWEVHYEDAEKVIEYKK